MLKDKEYKKIYHVNNKYKEKKIETIFNSFICKYTAEEIFENANDAILECPQGLTLDPEACPTYEKYIKKDRRYQSCLAFVLDTDIFVNNYDYDCFLKKGIKKAIIQTKHIHDLICEIIDREDDEKEDNEERNKETNQTNN